MPLHHNSPPPSQIAPYIYLNPIIFKGLLTTAGLVGVGAVAGFNTFNAMSQQNNIDSISDDLKNVKTSGEYF